MSSKNLSFSLVEPTEKPNRDSEVTYDSLVNLVNEQSASLQDNPWEIDDDQGLTLDDYVASEIDYNENYTKKQLELIADYYEISKRKKKKAFSQPFCYKTCFHYKERFDTANFTPLLI